MEVPILSEELKYDVDLKFSNTDPKHGFKKILEDSVHLVDNENLEDRFNVLNKKISFPNNYVFASLASRAYEEKSNFDSNRIVYGKKLDETLGNWQLLTVAHTADLLNGYFGAAYWNPDTQQVIIAHRGTQPQDSWTILGTLFTDIKGICLNQPTCHVNSAVTFTDEIISVLKGISNKSGIKKKSYIQLFFTGHSLGGWLAQITTFTAKYFKRQKSIFVKSENVDETGYHASAIVFDSPGSKCMLERIQDSFVSRYVHDDINGSFLINSLDITSYLSAPNIVNACNLHVGEKYEVSFILSEEERNWMRESFLGYTRQMHKREKFIAMFDPESGRVSRNEEGELRIRRIKDWPLLILGDDDAPIRDKVSWGAMKLAEYCLPGWLVQGTYLLYSKAAWFIDFHQELNVFFASVDGYSYELDDKSPSVIIGENRYRSVRHETKELSENYINERSINVFTQFERQFLDTYKLLERHQEDLGEDFKFKVFSRLEQNPELKKKTMDVLNSYEIKNGIICSENLLEFIPYVKRMLHFFPEMKGEVEEAQKSLPFDILTIVYHSASSSYVKPLVKDDFKFETDTLKLEEFLRSKELRILNAVQSSTFLGAGRVFQTFMKIDSCYRNDNGFIFLSLNKISYIGDALFIGFLCKIKTRFLLVVECDDVLNDKNMSEEFLRKLFQVLKNKPNIKVILITGNQDYLNNSISNNLKDNKLNEFYKIEDSKINFHDLTRDSQDALLRNTVVFQGNEVTLDSIVDRRYLNAIIDPETIIALASNKKLEIGKALPSLGKMEYYYINRKLIRKVKVRGEILGAQDMSNDLFLISNIRKDELLQLVNKEGDNFNTEFTDRNRFIAFESENEADQFQNLCREYSQYNIHWLKKESNGDFIWQTSCGNSLSGVRRYIKDNERDLSEEEYYDDNTSINIVDVDYVSKFQDRFIIIAAEPGMGKSTLLTHLGTPKINYLNTSKWLIRINLMEYKDKLEKVDFKQVSEIVNFFNESSNTLTRNLLESRLKNSGNIVLLFDGFDEITYAGQKNITNLLHKLQKETSVDKVFISTRLHLREQLENSFSTFAYTFKPFFQKEQEQFLKRFWQNDLEPGISQVCFDNYINQLLEFISSSIGDKERKFMGIPLQMKMVAEVFQKRFKTDLHLLQRLNQKPLFPENFDVFELYDRFIETKYEIYLEKIGGGKIILNNEGRKDLLTARATEVHGRIAFEELFSEVEPEITKKFFAREKPLSEARKQEINLVGIIQFLNGRAVFTHTTFGEYFVADFLINILNNKEKNEQDYKNAAEFLAKALFESKNEVLKSFLDNRLAKENVLISSLKGKLSDVEHRKDIEVTDALGRSALHYAAQEGHIEIVDALLKKTENVKADELGKTALHYAARYNHGKEVVSCLLENAIYCINNKDKNSRIPVYYAAQQGNWDIVDRILTENGASVEGLDKVKLLFHYTYKGSLQSIKNLAVEHEHAEDFMTIKDNHGSTLLHIAAQKGHVAILDFLLGKGADVELSNNNGKIPINYAAENRHWDAVTFLLRKKSNCNVLSSEQKKSLLNYSSHNSHWDIVSLFMNDGDRDGHFHLMNGQQKLELLCHSILTRNFNVFEFLLQKDIAINNFDKEGIKPINYAAKYKYWNIVVRLLRKSALFGDLSKEEKSLLIGYSAENAQWDVIKLFMEDNDRDEYYDQLGHFSDTQILNCLYYMISIDDLEITKFFIEKLIKNEIININLRNICGETFLHIAAWSGSLNVVKYLVDETCADVNAIANNESTSLHLAVQNNKFDVARYLTERGAHIYSSNENGEIPLDIARDKGYKPIGHYLSCLGTIYEKICNAIKEDSLHTVKRLIDENNIYINFKDKNGFTPLHIAAEEGNFNILKHLIRKGANFRIKNKNGYNVLHLAKGSSNLNSTTKHNLLCIIKYLIEDEGADPYVKTNSGNTILHLVSESGFLDALKYFIEERSVYVDLMNDHNSTPLHFASCQSVAEYLVKQGSDISIPNKFGDVPLHCAAECGCLDVVKYLIERNACIDVQNNDGNSPLHVASRSNKLSSVKYLIEKGADSTLINSDGKTPSALASETETVQFLKQVHQNKLLGAAEEGDSDMVGILIKHGVNIDSRDRNNCTPLHRATYRGHLDLVKELLVSGADVFAKNDRDTTLHRAVDSNKEEIIKLVLDKIDAESHGVNTESRGSNNYTPLHFSTNSGRKKSMNLKELKEVAAALEKELVEMKNRHDTTLHRAVDSNEEELIKPDLGKIRETQRNTNKYVDAEDSEGDTPLLQAVQAGNTRAVQLLLEYGADIRANNKEGMTALHLIAKSGNLEVANILFNQGADINAVDNAGRKPVHVAAAYGELSVIELFSSRQAVIVNETDEDGWTPLHYAACNGNIEVVDFLSDKGADTNAQGKKGRTAFYLAMAFKKLERNKVGSKADVFWPNSFDNVELEFGNLIMDMKIAANAGSAIPNSFIEYMIDSGMELFYKGRYTVSLQYFMLLHTFLNDAKMFGPKHPHTLKTHMVSAVVFSKKGRYTFALNILKDVHCVQKRPEILGRNHPDTLTTEHNLAEVLYKQGKYGEALIIYYEVLKRRIETLGDDHPDVFITMHHMARVRNNEGEHTKALTYFSKIFKAQCFILGADHPDTLKTKHNLAFTLYRLKAYQKASSITQDLLITSRNVLGEDHPDTLATKRVLALILIHHERKYDDALIILQDVLKVQNEELGPNHPDTLATRHDIAYVLKETGRSEEALKEFREVYEKKAEVLGADHPYVSDSYYSYQTLNLKSTVGCCIQ